MPAPERPTCAGHPACTKGGGAHSLWKNPKQKVVFHPCAFVEATDKIKQIWRDTTHLHSVPLPTAWIHPSLITTVCYASKGGHVLLAAPCALPTSPDTDIVLCNAAYQKPGFTTHHALKRGGPSSTPTPHVGEKRSMPQVQFAFACV